MFENGNLTYTSSMMALFGVKNDRFMKLPLINLGRCNECMYTCIHTGIIGKIWITLVH